MLAVLFLMAVIQANAQVEVRGSISDESGEAVIGASVVIKGQTGTGTVTDFDGNFKLKVPSGNATLVVTYIGMKTQEVKVSGKHSLKIILQEDKQVLQDVVVVGYGQQKKASIVQY